MYLAKISVYRLANYYFIRCLRNVLTLTVGAILLFAAIIYRSSNSPIGYAIVLFLALIFLCSLLLAIYLRISRKEVIRIDEQSIVFDRLLNQTDARILPKELIAIKLADIERISSEYTSTDVRFRMGRGVPDYWQIFRITLKDNRAHYYLNTLFINEEAEHRLQELIKTLK